MSPGIQPRLDPKKTIRSRPVRFFSPRGNFLLASEVARLRRGLPRSIFRTRTSPVPLINFDLGKSSDAWQQLPFWQQLRVLSGILATCWSFFWLPFQEKGDINMGCPFQSLNNPKHTSRNCGPHGTAPARQTPTKMHPLEKPWDSQTNHTSTDLRSCQ